MILTFRQTLSLRTFMIPDLYGALVVFVYLYTYPFVFVFMAPMSLLCCLLILSTELAKLYRFMFATDHSWFMYLYGLTAFVI